MRHLSTGLAVASLLLASAPHALAATTIIHAGELLAVPGKAAKSQQTIVLEEDRIVEIRNGYADAGEFEGEVAVIDLKDQFVQRAL